MKKILRIPIISISVGVLCYAAYFAYTNTHFLRPRASQETVNENNFNIVNTIPQQNSNAVAPQQAVDFETLQPKKLEVSDELKKGVFATERTLYMPTNFSINVFASNLQEPRFITFDDADNIIVADKGAGKIFLLKDTNADGVADETRTIDENLRVMHSVYFYKGDLYAAEETKVTAYRGLRTDGTYAKKETLISNLPTGGHSTRTVIVGPDEKIYLSIGSSCNLCVEKDERRAAVIRYNLDGTGQEIFATGLRNSVGIQFHANALWSVDNGRDRIGDNLPPEEVNVLEFGKDYGWPFCYGKGLVNPEYKGVREDHCKNSTTFPTYEMQAHSAPLGIAFMPSVSEAQKKAFPEFFAENLFIGFHGSWNRTVPTGYKVVRIDTRAEGNTQSNFITGWLDADGSVWGRPVDVAFDRSGAFYVTDDKAGAIYRVLYSQGND